MVLLKLLTTITIYEGSSNELHGHSVRVEIFVVLSGLGLHTKCLITCFSY